MMNLPTDHNGISPFHCLISALTARAVHPVEQKDTLEKERGKERERNELKKKSKNLRTHQFRAWLIFQIIS